jgi:hypothetical protein
MMPAIDDKLKIEPSPLATMAGAAYLMPKNRHDPVPVVGQ